MSETVSKLVSGILSPSMGIKILSWNMRGSNVVDKLHTLQRLVRKHKPLIVGLQETKRSLVTVSIARSLWGNGAHDWSFVPSEGQSGGIILLWDVDALTVHEVHKENHFVSLLCSLAGSDIRWMCFCVYGPCNPRLKPGF